MESVYQACVLAFLDFLGLIVQERRVQFYAVATVSTMGDAASATADGRGLNVTCQAVSVWMPSAAVMACVLRAPARVTQATKVTTVTKWTVWTHPVQVVALVSMANATVHQAGPELTVRHSCLSVWNTALAMAHFRVKPAPASVM